MLHEYLNLYFPLFSLIVSFTIFLLYFTKKNINNLETRLYSKIVVLTVVEATFSFVMTLLMYMTYNDKTMIYFNFTSKVMFSIYIIWISLLFLYYISITFEKLFNRRKFLYSFVLIVNLFIVILIFLSGNELIYNSNEKIFLINGLSINIMFSGCLFYILLMFISSFIDFRYNKKIKKYIPLLVLVFFMIFALAVRLIDPYINILSNIISFTTLIMYFTIENPDYKMNQKLIYAKMQIEKLSRVKREFISSMSHEIRTPLNAIVGYSELLTYANNLDEAKENAKDILESSETLLNMVNNIFDISLIDVNSLETIQTNYNLKETVLECVSLFKYRADYKKLKMKINIKKAPKVLIGDATVVKRIIANLIDNSIKYTYSGTIKIDVNTTVINDVCKINIVVEDSGIGIDYKTKEKLYEKFNRSHENKDSDIPGLGLGLFITKSLVDILNGEIICETKVGKGTKFTINFSQKVGK